MLDLASFFKRWDYDTTPIINFNGIWRNELGSEMELQVGDHGRVKGVYRPGKDETLVQGEHELVGFVNQNLITFSVDFEHHHILTSWTGHAVKDGREETIKTLWNLVKHIHEPDLPVEAWGSVYSGANFFNRVV